MRYRIMFYAYCGMTFPIAHDVDKEDVKRIVKERIKRARKKGQPVQSLGNGEYEFQTPEDAKIIADHEGTLVIKRM